MRNIKKTLALFLINATRHFSHHTLQYKRVKWLRVLGASIGNNVKIKPGVYIEYPHNLTLGNNVSIQHNCFISAYEKIEIGNDVSIAHSVSILTSTHPINSDGIIRELPLIGESVKIGNNVWIGMKASVLSGVTIGTGVVVGAHALVNKDVTDNSVVAGVPAKLIKHRVD